MVGSSGYHYFWALVPAYKCLVGDSEAAEHVQLRQLWAAVRQHLQMGKGQKIKCRRYFDNFLTRKPAVVP